MATFINGETRDELSVTVEVVDDHIAAISGPDNEAFLPLLHRWSVGANYATFEFDIEADGLRFERCSYQSTGANSVRVRFAREA